MSNEQCIEKIKELLEQMRPAIQMDGGDIEFVSFQEGTVFLRLHGACINCPMSFYTLKLGIEEKLKEHIEKVREVMTVE